MDLKDLTEFYRGRKVLITGHTGFKGSWLSIWLLKMGADVIGISLNPKTNEDNFVRTGLSERLKDYREDIRNKDAILNIFQKEKPDMVFHMAAQALVLEGYTDPVTTFETNFMGTVNVLEAIRRTISVKSGIFITTDKVYENKEWLWPYREDDRLGGYDPYSASKGASEIAISSYRNSFFNPEKHKDHGVSIASVRAGNVIGGGDWSENRIIPDCIRAFENEKPVTIRNPKAIRPWQFVLEPLLGYLILGVRMNESPKKYSVAWNFGPESSNNVNVGALVKKLIDVYEKGEYRDGSKGNAPHEARFLALDINKSKYELGWFPVLNFSETLEFTAFWYKNYKEMPVYELCKNQIEQFTRLWMSKNES